MLAKICSRQQMHMEFSDNFFAGGLRVNLKTVMNFPPGHSLTSLLSYRDYLECLTFV